MRFALIGATALLAAGCASQPPKQAVTDLAPSGTLRAAINVGNAVEAGKTGGWDIAFVAKSLELHRQTGAAVAPAGDAK